MVRQSLCPALLNLLSTTAGKLYECSDNAGLLGVMLLLGYGLVNIPRTLWREADAGTCLKRSLHR